MGSHENTISGQKCQHLTFLIKGNIGLLRESWLNWIYLIDWSNFLFHTEEEVVNNPALYIILNHSWGMFKKCKIIKPWISRECYLYTLKNRFMQGKISEFFGTCLQFWNLFSANDQHPLFFNEAFTTDCVCVYQGHGPHWSKESFWKSLNSDRSDFTNCLPV